MKMQLFWMHVYMFTCLAAVLVVTRQTAAVGLMSHGCSLYEEIAVVGVVVACHNFVCGGWRVTFDAVCDGWVMMVRVEAV